MFTELLQSLNDHYTKNLPFVVYRKPSTQLVQAIFQKDARVHSIKDFSETGFVFAPFDSRKRSVLMLADQTQEALYTIRSVKSKSTKIKEETRVEQREFHVALVRKGIDSIQSKALKKVVLSRNIEIKNEFTPIELFQKLLDGYSTAFCYLWYHPKIGTWLGATPEILLKTENQQITTMSLAGTQKFVENTTPKWGKKEIDEQQLVTDYISNAIEKLVSNLIVSKRESIQAGSLWHLRTKLIGRFKKQDFATILNALHPTPAVCGLPMIEAKKFILENENYDREYYTGYLGELNFIEKRERTTNNRNQENKAYTSIKTKTTLFVNLRSMKLMPHYVKVYIGGGVTADSDAEKEWQETVIKSTTMLRVLGDD